MAACRARARLRELSRAVAGDGGQAVDDLTHLALDGLEFIPGFDTGQGCSPGFGVGADVLPLAGAVVLGGVDEVEIARLAVAVFASVGGSQDGLELFKAGGLDELRCVAVVASDRFGGCVAVRCVQP